MSTDTATVDLSRLSAGEQRKYTRAGEYTRRLLRGKAHLLERIAEIEGELSTAKADAAEKLGGLPPGADMAEQSALAPVVALETKLGVYDESVAKLDEKIAEAPALERAYKSSLKDVEEAVARRDAVMAEAAAQIEPLLEVLFQLRQANNESIDALRESMKLWGRLGLAGPQPRFAPCRWPPELRHHLRNLRTQHVALPFIDLELQDDRSNPVARTYPAAAEVVDRDGVPFTSNP